MTNPTIRIAITPMQRKPRNPLVAAAQFRRAGRHGSLERAQRRDDARMLRREFDAPRHSP